MALPCKYLSISTPIYPCCQIRATLSNQSALQLTFLPLLALGRGEEEGFGGAVEPGQHLLHEQQRAVPGACSAAGARVPERRLQAGPQHRQPPRQQGRTGRSLWQPHEAALAGVQPSIEVQPSINCLMACMQMDSLLAKETFLF